jgi:hypothetical protein
MSILVSFVVFPFWCALLFGIVFAVAGAVPSLPTYTSYMLRRLSMSSHVLPCYQEGTSEDDCIPILLPISPPLTHRYSHHYSHQLTFLPKSICLSLPLHRPFSALARELRCTLCWRSCRLQAPTIPGIDTASKYPFRARLALCMHDTQTDRAVDRICA